MKKNIFILLLLALMIHTVKPVSANQSNLINVDEHKDVTNILDLNNFAMDHKTALYYTVEPITITKGLEYTIITERSFIGYEGEVQLLLDYGDGLNNNIRMNNSDDYLVSTFIAESNTLLIKDFKFKALLSPNIMLYQGIKSDFKNKFIPYTLESTFSEHELELDYDNLPSIEELDNMFTATNPNKDGEQLEVITVSNNYQQKVGNYQALYITNISKINSLLHVKINVRDNTPPVIITDELRFSNNMRISEDFIRSQVEVSDNYDNLTYNDLMLVESTYNSNDKVGEYFITYELSDYSYNYVEKTIKLTIYDAIAPIIQGPEALFVYTMQSPLTNELITSKFSVSDETDSTDDLTLTIIENNYNETLDAGTYNIKLEASDTSSNISTKQIVIHVIDNSIGKFVISPSINTFMNVLLTEDELIHAFKSEANRLGVNVSNVSVNKDVYDLNYNKEGTYQAYISYSLDNDEILDAEISIYVASIENDNNNFWFVIPIIAVVGIGTLFFIKKKRQLD